MGGKQDSDELINSLDNAFTPTTHLLLEGGERSMKTAPMTGGEGELINHDEAHRVFRSPRPSITLQELQELHELRERGSRKHSDDSASAPGTPSHLAMRGGLFGEGLFDNLWLARAQHLGGGLGLHMGSAALDAEAHKALEEAAWEEHDEMGWWDVCAFSDSQAEDVASGDSGCIL
jgi:hypothetical protein